MGEREARDVTSSVVGAAVPEADTNGREIGPLGGGEVLVVDDDPLIRAFAARALTLAGFEVAAAGGGRDALRLVADGHVRPAVLVTDIEMPGMTGVELAARLLALRPTLRVVMMTDDAIRAEAARRHPSIVDAVLLKPMRSDELVAAVRPLVGPASDAGPRPNPVR